MTVKEIEDIQRLTQRVLTEREKQVLMKLDA